MHPLSHLFENNKRWAARVTSADPEFFQKLSLQQQPEYLWIGCSDSRVPANDVVGLLPGNLFVHRNVANVIVHSDLNSLSVLQFAVEVLKVKHIIVCGHYECGGVKAAIDGKQHGLIDNWLQHIKDVYRLHKATVDALRDDTKKIDLMCELNVGEQVKNVCNSTIVRNAWRAGQELAVHGWIYQVGTGLLKDLDCSVSGMEGIPKD